MLSHKFRYSFKKGLPKKVLHTPYFTLRYETSHDHGTYAVVVGKKVDSRATYRNAIKRRFLQVFEQRAPWKTCTFTLVFYLKKEATTKNLEELGIMIEQAIHTITAKEINK